MNKEIPVRGKVFSPSRTVWRTQMSKGIYSPHRVSRITCIVNELLSEKITENQIEEIVDLTTNSVESARLVFEMKQMVDQLILKVRTLRHCRENLKLLATATLEDL